MGVELFKDCHNLLILGLQDTQVTDRSLVHIKDCKKLQILSVSGTQVTDAGLVDLAGLENLTKVYLTNTKVAAAGVKGLAKALPKCEITWDGGVIEPKLGYAPLTDADVQSIAALPAAEQAAEVRKELVRRNPGFDGKVEHKIEDGVVTEFGMVTDLVTDIAPIRAFNALRMLALGQGRGPQLADLTPL